MHALKYLFAIVVLGLSTSVAFADLEPGQTLPRINIELLGGETLKADQLAGKPVAYLFWATWCHVCRSELQTYQKLHVQYQARGFRVVALSLDESAAVAKQFWADTGYTFPVAMRSGAVRDAFGGIKGTPTLHVVDREGRLVKKQLGDISAGELEAIIKQLL